MSTTLLSAKILSETIVSFAQAAKRLPPGRKSRPTSPGTIWRWSREGVRAADGRVVILESCRIGGRSVTSVEALARFSAALTVQTEQSNDEIPTPRTPGQRERAAERAGKELEKLGI
jgi:hypothetical protein